MELKSLLPPFDIPDVPFHEYCFRKFRKYGNTVAMINNDTKEQFTYLDLIEKAEFIARSLISLGVEKSEVVLQVMDNAPECVYIALGVSLAGAVMQFMSPRLKAWEMQPPVEESETRFIFCDPLGLSEVTKLMNSLERDYRIICTGPRDFAKGHPILDDLRVVGNNKYAVFPTIKPEQDVVFLPYSSGIHGLRKGVLTTHKVMLGKTLAAQNKNYEVYGKGEKYTLTMLPFHKQMGFEARIITLLCGVVIVTEKKFCIHTMMTLLQKFEIASVHLTPELMGMMIFEAKNHDYDLSCLKCVISGSEALTEDLYNEFQQTFPSVKHVVQTYWMTEVGLICRGQRNDSYTSSCGKLVANLELKVIDIWTGKKLGPNLKGQILVRGVVATSPYLNNAEATRDHFVDGWRKTGDIGYYDDDQNIYLVDKMKEMIKVFGYQVIPAEIESLLLTHRAVEEAAVVAINNDISGERPVAFVVLKRGHKVTGDEIKQFVNKRMIRYKHLVQVHIAQMLPKSPCGRLLRKFLAEAAVMSLASDRGNLRKKSSVSSRCS